MRKRFSAEFMAKVALTALKEEKTMSELSSEFEVHKTQIIKWKKFANEGLIDIFRSKSKSEVKSKEKLIDELYRQIGQLKVENEWLKKKLTDLSVEEKKQLIEAEDKSLSIRKQCELLELNRSNYYYKPVEVDNMTLELMNRVDEIYTKCPFYGSRRIKATLIEEGWSIGRERIQGLMQKMGLEAIYPKPKLSKNVMYHEKYPYLLSNFDIMKPNQVWSTDITYIRLKGGFFYLVAIIDWYSRYILSWRLSNSLEVSFCIEALEEALDKGTPEIFNSDQGTQFTSIEFTSILKKKGIKISMDGRGRAFDNIFIERFWRTLKYEEVYLKEYINGHDAYKNLYEYCQFYNDERLHQALGYKTPFNVHTGL